MLINEFFSNPYYSLQIAGSSIALLYVSPGLTSVLMIAVPALVGCGWMIGAGLRVLSRKGQEQVASTFRKHPLMLIL